MLCLHGLCMTCDLKDLRGSRLAAAEAWLWASVFNFTSTAEQHTSRCGDQQPNASHQQNAPQTHANFMLQKRTNRCVCCGF